MLLQVNLINLPRRYNCVVEGERVRIAHRISKKFRTKAKCDQYVRNFAEQEIIRGIISVTAGMFIRDSQFSRKPIIL